MTDAVIFDLFGTLIYLDKNHRPLQKLFKGLHSFPRSLVRTRCLTEDIGIHIAHYAQLSTISAERNLTQLQDLLIDDINNTKTFDDARPVLEALKKRGIKLGLISNVATPYTACSTALELDQYFDVIIYSCEVGIKKPDADIFKRALKELNITDPRQALMVGDTFRDDVLGSRSVGMPSLHLTRGKKVTDLEASQISSLRDIEGYLDQKQGLHK